MKILGAVLELLAKQHCQSIQPIYLKTGPNWPNRQCWLAGSFKTALRIFIFSIPMGADYSFYVKTIETHAREFLTLNILAIGSVYATHNSSWHCLLIFTLIRILQYWYCLSGDWGSKRKKYSKCNPPTKSFDVSFRGLKSLDYILQTNNSYLQVIAPRHHWASKKTLQFGSR